MYFRKWKTSPGMFLFGCLDVRFRPLRCWETVLVPHVFYDCWTVSKCKIMTTTVNEIQTFKGPDFIMWSIISGVLLLLLSFYSDCIVPSVHPVTVTSCSQNHFSHSSTTSHLISSNLYTSWGTVKALLNKKIKFPSSVATASLCFIWELLNYLILLWCKTEYTQHWWGRPDSQVFTKTKFTEAREFIFMNVKQRNCWGRQGVMTALFSFVFWISHDSNLWSIIDQDLHVRISQYKRRTCISHELGFLLHPLCWRNGYRLYMTMN